MATRATHKIMSYDPEEGVYSLLSLVDGTTVTIVSSKEISKSLARYGVSALVAMKAQVFMKNGEWESDTV